MFLELKKNENFIATAVTKWHAHGIDVGLSLLESRGIHLSGVIYLCTFPGTKKSVTRDNFKTQNKELRFIECEFQDQNKLSRIISNFRAILLLSLMKHKKARKEKIYVFNVIHPNLNWICLEQKYNYKKEISFVMIDEGVGSYVRTERKHWVSLKINQYKGLKHIYYYFLYSMFGIVRDFIQNKAKKILVENGNYCEYMLFREITINGTSILEKNNEVIECYRAILEEENYSKIKKKSANILLNTQNLVEGGIITTEKEKKLWDKLAPVFNDLGYNIILKKHPREDNNKKYEELKNIFINDDNRSQEEITATSEILPMCVISPYSTTLVTLNLFWNIPAISLAYFLLDSDISNESRVIIETYIQRFNGVLMFPHNPQELKSMINGIEK